MDSAARLVMPDWPGNVCAKFSWRRGKVFNCLFSIMGMAYQSQNVNNSIRIVLLDLAMDRMHDKSTGGEGIGRATRPGVDEWPVW